MSYDPHSTKVFPKCGRLMSRPLERALLRQRGLKVVWVIVDVGLRPTGRLVCVHNTHPSQGHLALDHSVFVVVKGRSVSVSGAGSLSQHPKTFPPTLTAAQYSALDPGLTHSSSKTHLEAVFCGYEEHFKGLPPLEGDA